MFVDFGTLYPHKIVTDVPDLNKSLSAPKWCMLGKSDSNQTRLNFQSGISIFAGTGNLLVSVKAEKWNDCFFVKSSYFLSFFPTVQTNSSRRIFLGGWDIFMQINGSTSRILLCKAILLLVWCYVMWVWCYAKRFDSFGSVCSPFTYQGC